MQPPWQELRAQYEDKVVMIQASVMQVDELEPYTAPRQGTACGSGVFVGDGYVLTNCHVVCDAYALRVRVGRLGEETFAASTLHLSPERDLALLKVHDVDRLCASLGVREAPTVSFADSSQVLPGRHVLAVGHPLGMHQQVTTQGVVNAKQWAAERGGVFLQISAPINHGSSGGALFVATCGDTAPHSDDDDDDDSDDSEGGGPMVNLSMHSGWRLALAGVNSAGVDKANLVGFAIEVDEVKTFFADVAKTRGLLKVVPSCNVLGLTCDSMPTTLSRYLQLTGDRGVIIRGISPISPLRNGACLSTTVGNLSLHNGDILLSVAVAPQHARQPQQVPTKWQHEYEVDHRGQVQKVHSMLPFAAATANLSRGDWVKLQVWQAGSNTQSEIVAQMQPPPLAYPRRWLPAHDDDPECHAYTVFGGMVLRPLSENIISAMAKQGGEAASRACAFRGVAQQQHGVLVVTHVFPGSLLAQQSACVVGTGIDSINGQPVHNMQTMLGAMRHSQPETPVAIAFANGRVAYVDCTQAIRDTRRLQSIFHFQNTPEIDLLEHVLELRQQPQRLAQAHNALEHRVQHARVVRHGATVSLQ